MLTSSATLLAGKEEVENEPRGATSENHVQFATYHQESLEAPQQLGTAESAIFWFYLLTVTYAGVPHSPRRSETWTPLPLRSYFWIPLIVILVVAAIGLEIVLYLSNKYQGGLLSYFPLNGPSISEFGRLGGWRHWQHINGFALHLRMPHDLLVMIAPTYCIVIRHFLRLLWPPSFVFAVDMMWLMSANFFSIGSSRHCGHQPISKLRRFRRDPNPPFNN